MGLNFKLDVGLYRLDQQVACQRYRQTTIDAESKFTAALDKAIAIRNAIAPQRAFATV